MAGSYPKREGPWDSPWAGPTALATPEEQWYAPPEFVSSEGSPMMGPHNPREFAQRLYAYESLQTALPRREGETEPYSLEWFINIENQRHSKHGRWIPKLLEFAKHAGETLVGLGDGLGTDWLQYARHGAHVIVCSPSTSQLGLIRRNFELRGLKGRFLHSQINRLPIESATIDVACITNWCNDAGQPEQVIDEIYRILKPGGKVLAVTPARYDVDYWYRTVFFWMRWWRRTTAAASRVCFSGRDLKRLFGRFVEHRVHKRQLRRSEVPHVWRLIPLPLLARLMGRLLVLKAFKPLSAALPLPLSNAA